MPKMKHTPLRVRIGLAVRRRREATGLSQESFAPIVDMHRTYYSNIERGVKNLQIDTLERVCAGLGVPVWQIVRDAEGSGATSPPVKE